MKELVNYTKKCPSTIRNAIYFGYVQRRELIYLINYFYLKVTQEEEEEEEIIEKLKKL